MVRHSIRRFALSFLVVAAAAAYACNPYTEDLLGPPHFGSGGTAAGSTAETGGSTGGHLIVNGLGGSNSGGAMVDSGGVETAGGEAAIGGDPATGGDSIAGAGGGSESMGGAPAFGGSGGMATGGDGGDGGVNATGGAPTGGVAPGGAAGADSGGASTGGAPRGGAPTGGAPTGGTPTGGAPTGGAPTGGVGTGGLPAGFTAIDMLDVANNTIELQDGQGLWYVFHDGSTDGVITPDSQRDSSARVVPTTLPSPRSDSLLGVHVVANDLFTSWGAGVGFNLNSPNANTRLEYDVSTYTGIVFWARTGTGTVTLRVKVVTSDITPDTESGGQCTADCSDAFGYVIDLTTTWKEYSVPFASLKQQEWGYAPPGGFDPATVLAVQLQADPGVAFDVWLDDVRFYE